MKRAYTTYVRPVLEYCTQIWSPTLIKYIDLIENAQRSFTRRIPVLKNLSYSGRLANLDIESLELRRLRFDLLMYYKIIRGFVRIQCDDFFKFSIWNSLPDEVVNSPSFKHAPKKIDLSKFLKGRAHVAV